MSITRQATVGMCRHTIFKEVDLELFGTGVGEVVHVDLDAGLHERSSKIIKDHQRSSRPQIISVTWFKRVFTLMSANYTTRVTGVIVVIRVTCPSPSAPSSYRVRGSTVPHDTFSTSA